MNYINTIHKVENTITSKLLTEFCDFRNFNGIIIYRFPVYKYNNKPRFIEK